MLSIRLQRVGRVHEPVFRLVLTDSKNSTKSGRFLEILGSYDARNSEEAKFNNDKILYWISKGAQTSDTVNNLLVTRGLVKGDKRNVLSRRPLIKEVPVAEAPSVPAPVEAKEEVAPTPQVEETVEAPIEEAPKAEEPQVEEAPKEEVITE